MSRGVACQGLSVKPRGRTFRAVGFNTPNVDANALSSFYSGVGLSVWGNCASELIRGIPRNVSNRQFSHTDLTVLATCSLLPTLPRPWFVRADLLPLCPLKDTPLQQCFNRLVKLGFIEKMARDVKPYGIIPDCYLLTSKGFALIHKFRREMEKGQQALDKWLANR